MIMKKKAFICPIILGIILIVIGVCIRIPGGVLTTYKTLDGETAESGVFDTKFSSIDEYVGGDAYNYEIGASLVAGKMAGAIVSKTIFVVSGAICVCFGITMNILLKNKNIKDIQNTNVASSLNDNVDSELPPL